jgi:hypothetical protein
MTQPDRLTSQLAQAQLAEIAELERSLAVYGVLLTDLERKLTDARRRYGETAARLNE